MSFVRSLLPVHHGFFAWPAWLTSLNLRPKLMMAFAAMALLAGFCGTVGLIFVHRIGSAVSVFSDVTSPLLIEGMALADNAQRMRAAFLAAASDGQSADQAAFEVSRLHAEARDHLQALRRLGARAGVDLKLDTAELHQRDFVQILNQMILSHRREQAAALTTKGRIARFDEKRHEVEQHLLALVNRAEGKMSKTEDQVRVQVQTGDATVDGLGELLSDTMTETYPVLQGAYKLMRESEEVDELVKWYLAQTDLAALAPIQQQAQGTFRRINSVSRKLGGRLRDADGMIEFARIQQALADLEVTVLGTEGVFASQHDRLTAIVEGATDRAALDSLERTYLGVLDEVGSAVRNANQSAQQDAVNDIAQARSVIAASIFFIFVAGLLFGLFFVRRITAPVIRLTNQVVQIRKTGELVIAPDLSVTDRSDEIGTLASSFQLMVSELAEARHALITKAAEVRTQYRRLDAAINNMPQGLCMFDAEQRLIICNQRYAEIYRLKAEQMVPGTPLRTILEQRVESGTYPGDEPDYVERRIAAAAERKPLYIVNELLNGHVIAISHQPMLDGGSIATHEDITERRKTEAQIAFMAHHDALTRLPNRARFRDEMNKALHRVERGETLAVLCLDLDYFKMVNDTLGHPVGDELLQLVSDRIRKSVRPTDTVARLGGDEFAIVQVAAEQPLGATTLATRLIKEISEPYDVNGHQIVIGASIGIAVAPNNGDHPDRLLKNADLALYRAKQDGRGTYRFFEQEMDAKVQARRALELDLRKALALGEFELFYQPLISLQSKKITGFEALLRWRQPQRGLVSPAEFIPLAEEIGLIGPIGAWVLKEACIEAKKWPGDIKFAVNLSPLQFKNDIVVLDVIAALGASGLPAHRLELEITETVLLQDTEATVAILNKLRDIGVHISMDDFGTGYSSLGYLRKFPFDKIKIDRSFIHDLSETPDSIAIVRAVTGLGSSLGIVTTAEGVETEDQFRQLRDEGCSECQGYLFSEPKPASEIGLLLQRFNLASKAVA